jgi:hypothetical protein
MNIFKLASGLLLVISVATSMFAAGSIGKLGLEAVLGVDNCSYTRYPSEPKVESVDYTKQCESETTNNNKRQVADGIAMLVIALPLAVLFYRRTKE